MSLELPIEIFLAVRAKQLRLDTTAQLALPGFRWLYMGSRSEIPKISSNLRHFCISPLQVDNVEVTHFWVERFCISS